MLYLVFDGGLSQHIAALTEQDRDQWLEAIQLSGYDCMRANLLALQQQLETRRGQDPDLDVQMWRLRRNQTLGKLSVTETSEDLLWWMAMFKRCPKVD